MNPTKEEIKAWVDTPPRSREWLASQCGNVSPRTVNNWITSSNVEIPAKALRIIESLMRADKEKADAAQPSLSHLVVRVGVDEFEAWSRAALAKGQIVTDWAIDAIREAYEAEQEATKSVQSKPNAA
jgi:hypothetical protein